MYQWDNMFCILLQATARGVGSGVDDSISLDVHAINELKDKGFVATDDAPKYQYTADSSGNYSKKCPIVHMHMCDILVNIYV